MTSGSSGSCATCSGPDTWKTGNTMIRSAAVRRAVWSRPQHNWQLLLRGDAGLPACGARPVSAARPGVSSGPLESAPGGFVPQAERSAILAEVLGGVEWVPGTGGSPGGWPGWIPPRR